MAKTSQELEKEFIDELKTKTGKDLEGWMAAIKSVEIEKRNDILNWLKEQNNFGHMHASLLTGIYLNEGKPLYANEQNLLDNQFEKYPDMRPLFEHLQQKITAWNNAVSFISKKTYVSITGKREFAAVNIKKGELRLGMDLGDMPFDELVEKSKLTGPMPRISHMVILRDRSDISENLFRLLEIAYKRLNQ